MKNHKYNMNKHDKRTNVERRDSNYHGVTERLLEKYKPSTVFKVISGRKSKVKDEIAA